MADSYLFLGLAEDVIGKAGGGVRYEKCVGNLSGESQQDLSQLPRSVRNGRKWCLSRKVSQSVRIAKSKRHRASFELDSLELATETGHDTKSPQSPLVPCGVSEIVKIS